MASDAKRRLTILLALLLVGTASVLLGHRVLQMGELCDALRGHGDPKLRALLYELRLPRVAAAISIGALLALSGALLQGATRNLLAEPGLLGITGGARLAVMILLASVPPLVAGRWMAPSAFVGGAGAAALVWLLSGRGGGRRPAALLLTGIALTAAFHGVAIAMTVTMPADQFARAMLWSIGSLSGIGWSDVALVTAALAATAPLAWLLARPLDVLGLGDGPAMALGANPERVRLFAIALAVLGASICASVCGGIAFLGLLAPNLARRLTGARHGPRFALTALVGPVFLLIADTIARTLPANGELPTGILVAAVGTPYFLWLLVTR